MNKGCYHVFCSPVSPGILFTTENLNSGPKFSAKDSEQTAMTSKEWVTWATGAADLLWEVYLRVSMLIVGWPPLLELPRFRSVFILTNCSVHILIAKPSLFIICWFFINLNKLFKLENSVLITWWGAYRLMNIHKSCHTVFPKRSACSHKHQLHLNNSRIIFNSQWKASLC